MICIIDSLEHFLETSPNVQICSREFFFINQLTPINSFLGILLSIQWWFQPTHMPPPATAKSIAPPPLDGKMEQPSETQAASPQNLMVDDRTMSQALFKQICCMILDLVDLVVFAEKSIEHGNVPDVVLNGPFDHLLNQN